MTCFRHHPHFTLRKTGRIQILEWPLHTQIFLNISWICYRVRPCQLRLDCQDNQDNWDHLHLRLAILTPIEYIPCKTRMTDYHHHYTTWGPYHSQVIRRFPEETPPTQRRKTKSRPWFLDKYLSTFQIWEESRKFKLQLTVSFTHYSNTFKSQKFVQFLTPANTLQCAILSHKQNCTIYLYIPILPMRE